MNKAYVLVILVLLSASAFAEEVTVEDWQPHAYNGWRALVRYCRDSDCTKMNVDYVLNNVMGDSDSYFENLSTQFATGKKEVIVDREKYDKLVERIEVKMSEVPGEACRDSDRGTNELMKGYATGKPSDMYSDDSATDYCEGNILREYYLNDRCQILYKDINCSFKCGDGACISVNNYECSNYGEGYWCGNREDFAGQCQGVGDKVALSAVCDANGNSYCIKCSPFSRFQEECTSAKPCASGLQCTLDIGTNTKRCCNAGQCAFGQRCYNPNDMVAVSAGKGAVCTSAGWQYKTCSQCGEGILNVCDQPECTGLGCKFVEGFLWDSCVTDDRLSVCATGRQIKGGAPCTCGNERFISTEVKGNMGSPVESYCCSNRVCKDGCTATGECVQNLNFLREPYIQQGIGYVGIAWYIESEPNVVFSYGKTAQYELGRIETKNSVNLGVNYGTEILPDTKYYFRIAVNSTKFYESSFMTNPAQQDECGLLGENYWCATENQWLDECRGTGRYLAYSNCTMEGGMGRCVTCVSQEGDKCFQDGECASPNLCKPSGRYPENEKYCCPMDKCASVMNSGSRCVAEGGKDESIDGLYLTCINGSWVKAMYTGYLLVMPTQSASTVKIDGVNVGLSPVNKTVEAGTHNVTIEKTGYKTYTTSVVVNRGMHTEVIPTLQQATGQVRFVTNPSGAGVYTMGESSYSYRGTSPVTLTLPSGPNQGNIQMQYYRTEEWWINVEEGKVGNVTVNLVDCRTYGGEGYCPTTYPDSGGGI